MLFKKNWGLVFSFMYLVLVDPMDRSDVTKIQKYYVILVYILQRKMGKAEKTEVIKIPKTKRRKYGMNETKV